jgi:hypothetical protein
VRRRGVWVALGGIVAAIAAVLLLGFTDSLGTGAVLASPIGGWSSDGAGHDTFWDSPVFDVPGASLVAQHCHGSVEYVVQLGATAPGRSNPCYAAMGEYTGGSDELDSYAMLPGGKVLYRSSHDYGPWRYCVGGVIFAPEPTAPLESAPAMPNPC